MRNRLLVLAFVIVAAGCATVTDLQPVVVPLHYKMMAEPAEWPLFPLASCSAVSSITVTDLRDNDYIGKRYIEGTTATAGVMTSGNVSDWVREGAEAALRKAGVEVGKAGAPELRITVEQIVTNENVLHRAGYDGRIAVTGALGNCWKRSFEGVAENYGYAGKVENYQEMLNHALDRVVLRMVNDKDFQKGLCGC